MIMNLKNIIVLYYLKGKNESNYINKINFINYKIYIF